MNLKELLTDPKVKEGVSLELYLYKLLEGCGVSKSDILSGKHDEQIHMCMDKIINLLDNEWI